MVFSAPLGEGGVFTPSLFHSIYELFPRLELPRPLQPLLRKTSERMLPVAKFLVQDVEAIADSDIKSRRTGPPGYINRRDGTSTLCQSRLYPSSRGLRIGPLYSPMLTLSLSLCQLLYTTTL